MIALIQRVFEAEVSVKGSVKSKIGEGLIVYPNPFNNSFALQLPIGLWQEKKLLKLYDIEGKNVFSAEVNETNDGTIKLSLQDTKLPSGIYFGCLVTDEKKLNFKLTYVR